MKVVDHQASVLSVTSSIQDALKCLDKSPVKILLILASNGHLLGTVTDGDIRRGILAGHALNMSVENIMNTAPLVLAPNVDEMAVSGVAKERLIRYLPLVDVNHHIQELYDLEGKTPSSYENLVVLMAGGLGSRLSPLTDDIPKPLLKVGNVPILQIIIENFAEHGFQNVIVSLNYKAEMIRKYFGNGSALGVNIEYVTEIERLGTAGALSLLDKSTVKAPFFVMNGDLLTKVNFSSMLAYHLERKAVATIGVREYDFQVPYGVVKSKEGEVYAIDEKPRQRFFVSAGMYLLDPTCLDWVPEKTFYDMPTLLNKLMQQQDSVVSFPIHEYWLDIGQHGDYHQANNDFGQIFGERNADHC